jgi:hypothetical protein
VRNGRLPAGAPLDEYGQLFGATPLDAWGKPVLYTSDANLAAAASGGICGRTATALSYLGQDVAFLLVSGGEASDAAATPEINAGTLAGPQGTELYRVVTLSELRAQAGCAGGTRGDLRIVNNELPNACKGIPYAVPIVSDGGVAPVSLSVSGLPAGLGNSGPVLSGTTTTAKGAYTVLVTATDSQLPGANTVQKKFILNVMSSCSRP